MDIGRDDDGRLLLVEGAEQRGSSILFLLLMIVPKVVSVCFGLGLGGLFCFVGFLLLLLFFV